MQQRKNEKPKNNKARETHIIKNKEKRFEYLLTLLFFIDKKENKPIKTNRIRTQKHKCLCLTDRCDIKTREQGSNNHQ